MEIPSLISNSPLVNIPQIPPQTLSTLDIHKTRRCLYNASMTTEPLLTLRGICKSFPSVVANAHVDLDVYGGEVHALLGENGAGKSTLMKIAYGFYRADAGEITLEGKRVHIRSPYDARQLRIGMVFQEFTLIPALNVIENVALFLPTLGIVLNHQQIADKIKQIAERYQLQINPWAIVGQLSVGEQQKVEVLKLLLADARVLILDEPTKVLAPHEVEGLFRVFQKLKQDGYAVIFITHKLREVLACADRITVMRQGKVAGTLRRAEASESQLIELMFGTAAPEQVHVRASTSAGDAVPCLEMKNVETRGEGAAVSLRNINLKIMPGEIVGVAGVSGNGQRELGDVVLGIVPCVRGQKFLLGQDATRWSVNQVRAAGVAFIPENPLGMALCPWLSIRENMVLANVRKYAQRGGFALDWQTAQQDTFQAYGKLGLKPPPLWTPARALSGGNAQRLVLVRELGLGPKLIVALYPSRGLDVPSTNAAQRALVKARDDGAGVLLISEDLGELFALCDRLVVMYHGAIVGEFKPSETTITQVGYLMTGAEVPHDS